MTNISKFNITDLELFYRSASISSINNVRILGAKSFYTSDSNHEGCYT